MNFKSNFPAFLLSKKINKNVGETKKKMREFVKDCTAKLSRKDWFTDYQISEIFRSLPNYNKTKSIITVTVISSILRELTRIIEK